VPSRRPDITDIVLCWEADLGQAVFVIEAKRVGGKLSDKDLDGGSAYLQLPSIKASIGSASAFWYRLVNPAARQLSFHQVHALLLGRPSASASLHMLVT